MNEQDQALSHALRVQFGTAPSEPSETQLAQIKRHIEAIRSRGVRPRDVDWATAVRMYCPSAGSHVYAGVDNSDLNTLLELAQRRGS